VNAAFSQDEMKNTIKFNAIAIFKRVFDFKYEMVISDRNSLEFGIGIGNYSSTAIDKVQALNSANFGSTLNYPIDGFVKEKTFLIDVGYRHYYMKNNSAPRGLYLSPSIQYAKIDNSYGALESGSNPSDPVYSKREYNQSLNIVNIRALIGCQLVIAKLICVNPYFGPSYAFGSAKNYNGENNAKAKGILLNVGIFVGIGF
jgi:hypothetical protein